MPLLLQITYVKTGGTHNLIGLIWSVAVYTTGYGAEFAKPTRVGAYDTKIDDDAMAIVYMRTKPAHKAKHVDSGTYKTAWRETAQGVGTLRHRDVLHRRIAKGASFPPPNYKIMPLGD